MRGNYGAYAWTYDAVGNRTSETLGSVQSTYAYPTTSNRLASITPGTGTARAFTYDAAGNIVTDTRTGALGLTYQYDVEGRLAKVYQTNATANGATYRYDAQGRLSARTVTQSSAPTSTTTLYVYDLADHLIAELNASGQTQKEYIWLDDMPVAVVDNVASGSPVIYYVHVDHLMRPIRMTDQAWTWVWDVVYAPFGGTPYLYTNPEVMNGRFPGQWFQLETSLAYNWHRHYDPTTGRYLQPDPLLSDESGPTVAGLPVGTITGGSDGHVAARSMGWKEAHDIIMGWPAASRPMLQDGPSVYGYAGQSPLSKADANGEQALVIGGGEIGFALGGPPGALVGSAIGVGATVGALICEMRGQNPTSYRDCTREEYAACEAQCAARGVDSCKVGQRSRLTETAGKGRLKVYTLKDAPVSCSCNE